MEESKTDSTKRWITFFKDIGLECNDVVLNLKPEIAERAFMVKSPKKYLVIVSDENVTDSDLYNYGISNLIDIPGDILIVNNIGFKNKDIKPDWPELMSQNLYDDWIKNNNLKDNSIVIGIFFPAGYVATLIKNNDKYEIYSTLDWHAYD